MEVDTPVMPISAGEISAWGSVPNGIPVENSPFSIRLLLRRYKHYHHTFASLCLHHEDSRTDPSDQSQLARIQGKRASNRPTNLCNLYHFNSLASIKFWRIYQTMFQNL